MPADLGGDATNDQYIDFESTTGKYALLMVPDYDVSQSGKQTSYASFGASAIPDTSYSVWARFRGATSGIRQHTDGQLVTTTKAERLEVVGGNYELHIRGTANDPTAYDSVAEKSAFRNSDQAYQRLGLHDGTPHLPDFLDADATKKAEIERIITTVTRAGNDVSQFAWEDHAGGHRLTTTKGDKLEIVKGKSYIHVLGADDFDVSEGQKAISRSGSDPQSPGFSASQNNDKRPFIVDRTWARRTISETWLGVDNVSPNSKLPIDEQIQLTSFPDVIDGEAREYTYGKKLSSYTGDSDNWVDDIEEHTYAKRVNSFTTVDASNEVMMAKGAIAETTLVPFMTSTQVSVLLNEVYVGAHTQVEIGAGIEIKLGAYLEIFGGAKLELEFAPSVTVTAGKSEISLFKKDIMTDELKLSLSTLESRITSSKVEVKRTDLAGTADIIAGVLKLGA